VAMVWIRWIKEGEYGQCTLYTYMK
jgi:hypothetical protein